MAKQNEYMDVRVRSGLETSAEEGVLRNPLQPQFSS